MLDIRSIMSEFICPECENMGILFGRQKFTCRWCSRTFDRPRLFSIERNKKAYYDFKATQEKKVSLK